MTCEGFMSEFLGNTALSFHSIMWAAIKFKIDCRGEKLQPSAILCQIKFEMMFKLCIE
jgi:hypothetical protein